MNSLRLTAVALCLVVAGCGGSDSGDESGDKPREKFEQPYVDKVKEMEAKQIQQAKDQLEAIDEQTGGKKKKDDDDQG